MGLLRLSVVTMPSMPIMSRLRLLEIWFTEETEPKKKKSLASVVTADEKLLIRQFLCPSLERKFSYKYIGRKWDSEEHRPLDFVKKPDHLQMNILLGPLKVN
jgi:hypothetical protein